MKKIVLLLTVLAGGLTMQAEDYTYLTFETTDGTKTSVNVSSLTLTISGTTLTVGGQQFTLSDLSKMYFSTNDESTTATDIDEITTATLDDTSEIYDLQGKKITKGQMRKGVYIVKNGQIRDVDNTVEESQTDTYKIVVK